MHKLFYDVLEIYAQITSLIGQIGSTMSLHAYNFEAFLPNFTYSIIVIQI